MKHGRQNSLLLKNIRTFSNGWDQEDYLSSVQNPGWLFYIEDYFISHEIRIPSLTNQYFNGMSAKGLVHAAHFGISLLLFLGELTLPETNHFAHKNGWLEYKPFLLGFGLFSGALAVSFRELKRPFRPFIRGITPFRGLTNHGY